MNFTPVTTADGSLSCLDAETGELCHNRAGAYTEALQHYTVPSSLLDILRERGEARILDACYGMGYNTWVLANEALRQIDSPFTLTVTAIEKRPEILGYLPEILRHPMFDPLKSKTGALEHNTYYRTLECAIGTKGRSEIVMQVAENGSSIRIEFLIADLRTCVPHLDGDYDAVFHDPFSPQRMPELWTVELFKAYHRLLAPRNGKLLTYSAAAAVRGGLVEAGFAVRKSPGLGARSGGTIAFTTEPVPDARDIAEPLDDFELAYLGSKAGIPYRDPQRSAVRESIRAVRQLEQQNAVERPSGSEIKKLLQK